MRIGILAPEDIGRFAEQAQQRYAAQMTAHGGLPPEEAVARAERQTRALFPDGGLTPGHAVLAGRDDEGHEVGQVWIGPHTGAPGTAFIYDVFVLPAYQGKGFGRALVKAAEAWARERDLSAITLSVFSGNQQARSLYRGLDYQETSVVMRREL
ncbi:MAG: GNAT family N-acetyltransferase [Micrococcales bacterium]|nr:GNAT family N-acetyltransferase [Micrococcales bacterium]